MQGRVLAALGLALVLAGAAGLYAAYGADAPAWAAAAWVAILAGALALLAGIGRFMTGFMASQHAAEVEFGPTEVRLLIQCMGAVAAADGTVQPEEMGTIARIHERVLGLRIDEDEVAEILGSFDASFDIRGRLVEARPELSPLMRERMLKSCYLVMMSDLKEDRTEMAKVREIGEALGFVPSQIDDILAASGV